MWEDSLNISVPIDLVRAGTDVAQYEGVLQNPTIISLAFGLCLRGLYCRTGGVLTGRNFAEVSPEHLEYESWLDFHICGATNHHISTAYPELECTLGTEQMLSFCEVGGRAEEEPSTKKGGKPIR